MRQSRDVSIDDDTGRDLESIAQNHVCGFSCDARKFQEFFHRVWHFPPYFSVNIFDVPWIDFVLLRKKPVDCMSFSSSLGDTFK